MRLIRIIPVVIHAEKHDLAAVTFQRLRVFPVFNLLQCRDRRFVVLKFNDNCGLPLLCPNQKLLHIQIYNVIFVQMHIKCIIAFYFIPFKKLVRIASSTVIHSKHFKRHRLAKAVRPADADKFLFRIDAFVYMGNKPCLINIYFRIYRFPKAFIARI